MNEVDATDRRADRARMPRRTSSSTFTAAFRSHAVGVLIVAALAGCSAPPTNTPATALPVPTERPIAMVDGTRLELGEIEAALLERAGAEIVRERVLDRAIAREAARRGLVLPPEAERRERSLLIETLSNDPDRAERLLEELRAARGLGPTRFASLLRRNAMLRALVAEDVEVSDDVIEAAWDAVHGPTRVTRIIAVADLRDATQVRRRLLNGEDFAAVAVETSLDASGPRGGRLGPVSRLDPAWPRAFREAIFTLEPGELSKPVPVDGRVLLIEVLEARPESGVSFEADRERAARVARLAAERLLMDRLARRLVPEGTIKPLSPPLRWSLSGDDASTRAPAGSQVSR
jgi:hypothetical protein